MLLSAGGVVDEFFHASAGEEVRHLFDSRSAHSLYGDHAFGVERLGLRASLFLAGLLLRLFLFLLFFGLLLGRWRGNVLLADDGLLSGLGSWDRFGLLPLELLEGELVEDVVEFWREPGEVLEDVSSVPAVVLGQSPPDGAVEHLHRLVEVLVRQLSAQVAADAAPFLPQVSDKFLVRQLLCALQDVLDVEHWNPVVLCEDLEDIGELRVLPVRLVLQQQELDRPQLLLLGEVLQQQLDAAAYSLPRHPLELHRLLSSPDQELGAPHVQVDQVSVLAFDERRLLDALDLARADARGNGLDDGLLRLVLGLVEAEEVGIVFWRRFRDLDDELDQVFEVDGRDLVVALVEVGQFWRVLQPGSLEELVESVLAAAVDDARADDEHLHVLPLYGQHLVLDLLYELVLRQGHSRLVVAVLVMRVFDRFLLHLSLLVRPFLLLAFVLLNHLRLFRLHLDRLCVLDSSLGQRRRRFLLDLPRRVAPDHHVADQYEHLVVLKWFGHGLDAELDVCDFGLVETVDIDLAFLDDLLPEELGLFPLYYLLYA